MLAVARRRDGVRRLVAATADDDGGSPTLGTDAAERARGGRTPAEPGARPRAPGRPRRRDARGRRVPVAAPPDRPAAAGPVPPRRPAAMERRHAVAIVGTRRPTEVGRATAGRIADAVAALGATIVSGLALGVDGAAHAAAVRAGTPTIAVIGGGHDRLYPAAHAGLARAIAAGGGAVVSEFAPQTHPTRGTFPRRNRLISGFADATVVVEAGARSGALTTAAWALEQGRGLHIVPGRLDDPSVAGSLAFLREAGDARVVAGIPELLEDLGLLAPDAGGGARPPFLAALTPVERVLAAQLADGRGSLDELVGATGQGSATVLAALTSLEMRGLVIEAFGRYRATGALAGRTARRRPGDPAGGLAAPTPGRVTPSGYPRRRLRRRPARWYARPQPAPDRTGAIRPPGVTRRVRARAGWTAGGAHIAEARGGGGRTARAGGRLPRDARPGRHHPDRRRRGRRRRGRPRGHRQHPAEPHERDPGLGARPGRGPAPRRRADGPAPDPPVHDRVRQPDGPGLGGRGAARRARQRRDLLLGRRGPRAAASRRSATGSPTRCTP